MAETVAKVEYPSSPLPAGTVSARVEIGILSHAFAPSKSGKGGRLHGEVVIGGQRGCERRRPLVGQMRLVILVKRAAGVATAPLRLLSGRLVTSFVYVARAAP